MNTQNNSFESLEEMVFEHRNKSYGAYIIRRQYGNTMKRAIASMFGVSLLFAGGLAWGMNAGDEAAADVNTSIIVPVDITPKKEVEPPKKMPEDVVKPKTPAQANDPAYSPTPQPAITDPPIVQDTVSKAPPVAAVAGSDSTGHKGGAGSGPRVPQDTTGTVVVNKPDKPVEFADVPPACDGLRPYLLRTLTYPQAPKDDGIEGTVLLSFVVDTTGSVQNLTVEKGVHPALDREAVRVARNMPKWTPATIKGHKVSFLFRLPIKFRLK